MLVNVESFLFNSLINTQAVQFLDTVEQGEATGSCPEIDDQDAKQLSTEESPAVTIERAIRSRQQTRHQCTQNTTDTVYRAGTYRVVDMQFMVNKLNGINQYDTAYQTNDDGSKR